MRNVWVLGLAVAALVQPAVAQGSFIPVIGAASREYGLSGNYIKQKDAANNARTDFTILGHWGIIMPLGLQPELEAGYGKIVTAVPDVASRNYLIGGNILLNVSPFNSISVFGLAGYGYIGDTTDRTLGTTTTTTEANRWYSQFGGGVKWLLVPNAGLRVDYRFQRGATLDVTGATQTRHNVLFGISVFQ
jgi:opacity protein-like surface antigen